MIYVGDSMAKVRRLFGTDGIRGKFVAPSSSEKLAIAALHDDRVICSTLMRLVGTVVTVEVKRILWVKRRPMDMDSTT